MNKGKGQRHEMTVLVVALGVLVAAVGLFVLRSRPAPAPPPPAPVAAPEKPPVEPKPEGEKSPVGRDPFASEHGTTEQARRAAAVAPPAPARGPGQRPAVEPETKQADLRLVGITSGTPAVATIHRGKNSYPVKVGQTVGGYTVARISADRVVLTKGTEQVTLLLHPPVQEE
jgi:Tfp pilus assembly protein PilP